MSSHDTFICPDCYRVSHHPEDVKHRYCGACHRFFTIDRTEAARAEVEKCLYGHRCPCCGGMTLQARSEGELYCIACHAYCLEEEATKLSNMEAVLSSPLTK